MIKLDDNLLQELGLGVLSPEEKKKMLAHIYETLEMRVGMELAKQMTDAQLNEFEQFINRNDEAGALQWLEANFPNYKDVVAAEFEKLKGEIRQVAPQIIASQQQVTQPQVQQPMMQQQIPQQPQYPQMQQPYPSPQPGYAPQQPIDGATYQQPTQPVAPVQSQMPAAQHPAQTSQGLAPLPPVAQYPQQQSSQTDYDLAA